MSNRLSRRDLLLRGLQASAGGVALAALAACGSKSGSGVASSASTSLCYDPAKVDPSQESMRETLHYTEASPNQATVCEGCTYSTFSNASAVCGTCSIFSGGPVNAHGHCDSWAKRA